MTILTADDPGLRQPARPANVPDRDVDELVGELVATMRGASGFGLSAPQVGVALRVAVVEVKTDTIVLINPEVTRRKGKQVGWEGCLSVPHYIAAVERPAEIEITGVDATGRRTRWRRSGLVARAIAHEIDHLDGRLYVDLVPKSELIDVREHPTPPLTGPGGKEHAR